MKNREYLMTDIYYRNEGDNQWHRWSYTDGCPTGREYDTWKPDDIEETLEAYTDYLNSHLCCVYEKPISPCELKFTLRQCPEEGSPVQGYLYMDKWDSKEKYFTKNV